jgi:K+ transporter
MLIISSTPQAFFGTGLTMADGILTPAVSLTSCVSENARPLSTAS